MGAIAAPAVRTYRDLEIWQEGVQLADRIYQLTSRFPKDEAYGMTSQMRRAAVSIPVNIAEGHARQHRGEYRQFLYVALGSIAELETLGAVAERVKLITAAELAEKVEQPAASVRNKTLALLRRLK